MSRRRPRSHRSVTHVWPALGAVVLAALSTLSMFVALFPSAGCHAPDARKERAAERGNNAVPRVIALSPSVTETIFALGAERTLVAVTPYCDRPAAAQTLPKLDPGRLSVEQALATGANTVIAIPYAAQERALAALQRAGLRVITVKTDTIADVHAMITTLGSTFGREREAAALNAQLRAELKGPSHDEQGKKRMLVLVGGAPWTAAGAGTFIHDVIGTLGYANAAPSGAWPSLTPEHVIAADADVIVLASSTAREAWRRGPLRVPGAQVIAPVHDVLLRPGPALLDDLAALRAALRAPEPRATGKPPR